MPTKWYWVNHGRLTRERKGSHFPSSLTNHSTIAMPAARALEHQAPCLIHEQSTGSERVDGVIICMITRDFSVISIDVTGVSLSLPLTKVTHAQYRKRGSASYKQEYIRTRVGNSILWGLSRQNSKFVIDMTHNHSLFRSLCTQR